LTVDDGDGQYVLTVNIRMTAVPSTVSLSSSSKPENADDPQTPRSRSSFNVREFQRQDQANGKGNTFRPPIIKIYKGPDVRVGDTVRVVGRVNEWLRGASRIRDIDVNEGAGDSVGQLSGFSEIFN
jgi:hypothetical protein